MTGADYAALAVLFLAGAVYGLRWLSLRRRRDRAHRGAIVERLRQQVRR